MSRYAPGKAGIIARRKHEAAVSAFSAGAHADAVRNMVALVAEFKARASAFGVTHRDAINRSPEARRTFLELARKIGVDPLASSKNMWGGVGLVEFYADLAIAAFGVCMATRKWNGGLIPLRELTSRLQRLRAGGGGSGGAAAAATA